MIDPAVIEFCRKAVFDRLQDSIAVIDAVTESHQIRKSFVKFMDRCFPGWQKEVSSNYFFDARSLEMAFRNGWTTAIKLDEEKPQEEDEDDE